MFNRVLNAPLNLRNFLSFIFLFTKLGRPEIIFSLFTSAKTKTLEALWVSVFLVATFLPTRNTHFKVNNKYTRATFFNIFSLSLLQILNRCFSIKKDHKQNGHFPDDYSYIFRFMISATMKYKPNNSMRRGKFDGKVAFNQIFLRYTTKWSHKNRVKTRTMQYYISVLWNYSALAILQN